MTRHNRKHNTQANTWTSTSNQTDAETERSEVRDMSILNCEKVNSKPTERSVIKMFRMRGRKVAISHR